MQRCAFIDVSNTLGTVAELLDFTIDWSRLLEYLRGKKWACQSVFYYKGNKGTKKDKKRLTELERMGYTIRTKLTLTQKDKIKKHVFICASCHVQNSVEIKSHGQRKSNCDVELALDALENAASGKEFLIFSGDGDFSYLIEKLIEKNVRVRIVSNTGTDSRGNKTFSSRLKDIIHREEKGLRRVGFIDIRDWKKEDICPLGQNI